LTSFFVTTAFERLTHLSAKSKCRREPNFDNSRSLFSLDWRQSVSFFYKAEIDAGPIPQFGLIADEVEKVNPDE